MKSAREVRPFRRFLSLILLPLAVAALAVGACAGPEEEAAPPVTVFSSGQARAGVPAPGLSGYRIAYYAPAPTDQAETLPGAAGSAPLEETAEPFTVVDYGPVDELPQEIRKPSIYVVFSQPVVPLAQLGAPLRTGGEDEDPAGALLAIDPPLAGTFRWYGSRLLAFEPDDEVLPQRRYTVTVSDRLRSLGGKELEGERQFSFETERLSLREWDLGDGSTWVSPWNASPEGARQVGLVFSSPVELEEIARWIEVRAGGQPWPFTLSRLPWLDEKRYDPDQGALLLLDNGLPLDADVEVTLREGARPDPEALGAREARTIRFHTLRPFTLQSGSARSYTQPRTETADTIPLYLQFSQTVDPDTPPELFVVDGMPPLTRENLRFYGSTVMITGLPLEYETSYTLRVSQEVKDLWGRTLVTDAGTPGSAEAEGAAEKTITLKVGPASSYVYFLNQGARMLEAGYPARIVWEAQNPVSLSQTTSAAAGPYEYAPAPKAFSVTNVLKNVKTFFMEDLAPYLGPGGAGSVAFRWAYQTRSTTGQVNQGSAWLTVQVTDLGITTRYAYNRVLVWVTRLSSGEPVAGARVELLEGTAAVREGVTDAQGLAVFPFEDGAFAALFTQPDPSLDRTGVVGRGFRVRATVDGGAQAGGDQVEFIPNDSHNLWRFDVETASTPFQVEAARQVTFLFTDRGLYRPGETLTFRGIDRTLLRGEYQAYTGPYTVTITGGSGYARAGQGTGAIPAVEGVATASGGSYGSFTLPENLEPGTYTLLYRRTGAAAGVTRAVTFTVANFERLRFEASLAFPDSAAFQGEKLTAALKASYLAGGGLNGASYTYYWTREPVVFNPGGRWETWRLGPQVNDGRSFISQGEGVLEPDGSAYLSHTPGGDGVAGAPYRYRLEASVQDPGRQEVASWAAALVHPAAFYLAARLDPGSPPEETETKTSAAFLAAGEEAVLSWALVTPGGELWAAEAGEDSREIALQLVRYEWKQSRQQGVGGRINLNWERVEEVVEERVVRVSGPGAIREFRFTPRESGQWEVRLTGQDAAGRAAATRFGFYVSGAGWVRWGGADADAITLTPNQASYAPGDTARILVRSPLPQGAYLLTIEREGIISEKIIELDGSARTIDIPIDESYIPIVYVALSSYTTRSGPPANTYYEPDLDKPQGVFGLVSLRVDSEPRHYQVTIESARGAYRPGERAEVTLRVTRNGRPQAGVELSFMAVDRGVVDLIDYHVPDPLAFFYDPGNFPLGVRGADSRSLLIDPVTYSLTDLQGGDAGTQDSKLEEREDFRPTAVFEPYLVTGANGEVTVGFTLPDSLTTYRCTAVAVGQEAFGITEADLRVSAPLTALTNLPRKLRWRDTSTASLILTNLEKEPVTAQVSLVIETVATEGSLWPTVLEVSGPAEITREIPPGESRELPFTVAAVGAGEARLVFTLRSPEVNERIAAALTVDRPVVYETVTTIGSLDAETESESGRSFVEEGVVLPVFVPEGTGSLTVSLAVSRLAALSETVKYLLAYPYGCLEQRTAKLIPLLAFPDRLDLFGLDDPVADPRGAVAEELASLVQNQLPGGGFPYWPGGRSADTFITIRAAQVFALARAQGWALPAGLDTGALLDALAALPNAGVAAARDPFLQGYALWVRALYGEQVGTEITTYLMRGDELGLAGWSFAGLAALELGMKDLARSTLDRVKRFLRPGTRTVDLTDTYESRGGYWDSDTARYALAFMLYQSLAPADDMTTRLATSLLARRGAARWETTAASYWAVLAFARAEALPSAGLSGSAALTARVSLGGLLLQEQTFTAASAVSVTRRWAFGSLSASAAVSGSGVAASAATGGVTGGGATGGAPGSGVSGGGATGGVALRGVLASGAADGGVGGGATGSAPGSGAASGGATGAVSWRGVLAGGAADGGVGGGATGGVPGSGAASGGATGAVSWRGVLAGGAAGGVPGSGAASGGATGAASWRGVLASGAADGGVGNGATGGVPGSGVSGGGVTGAASWRGVLASGAADGGVGGGVSGRVPGSGAASGGATGAVSWRGVLASGAADGGVGNGASGRVPGSGAASGGATGADAPAGDNASASPLDALDRGTLLPLRIEREGPGRLYYTASLRYGIPAELAAPRDEGISVYVETFDAAGRPVNDSRLTAGQTYTRRITLSTSRGRTYLALKAPVPSGAAIVDAAFVTSSTVPPAAATDGTQTATLPALTTAAQRFVMDDEIRFHWNYFPPGRQQVEFRFRAVMPGVYPTPPAQAECMYEEEIFGRSAGELVVIE